VKILVFTPVGIQSAIAKVSRMVVAELEASGHHVDVVSTQKIHPAKRDVRKEFAGFVDWRDGEVQSLIENADMIWHQVGNSYDFHAGSVYWLPRTRGVISLHDYFLGGLLWGWAADGFLAEANHAAIAWYGRSIEWIYDLALPARLQKATWPKYSFAEWMVQHADAVIAHSDLALSNVLAATGGPVEVLPLPYEASVDHNATDPDVGGKYGRKTVLTFGGINANKAADVVIAAISANIATRDALEYRLVGSIAEDMRASLTSLADIMGVRLTIVGQVSDDRLNAELANADLICCLRIPSLESASATAIESMLWSKPTIVADTGFYSSLPDDAVFKVNVDHVSDELVELLDRFAQGTLAYEARAEKARLYAESTFVADTYAVRLLALAEAANRHRAEADIVRTYTTVLGQWGMSDPSVIGPELDDILGLFR
jgi:glycosyltransferase involved in cell wall biosynthesis